MGATEREQYLNHLAVDKGVAASTQHQALSALIFLYRHVLDIEIGTMDKLERAQQPERLPVVLTETEVLLISVGVLRATKNSTEVGTLNA
ncbi:MAG: intINeu [Acidobacteria bacterium]|nr:intINeu [Acidobacteriota bacterium]